MTRQRLVLMVCLPSLIAVGGALAARQSGPPDPGEYLERSRRFSEQIEAKGLAEPFKGITTNGTVVRGLFPIRSTGVSTEPVRQAAERFLATLDPGQRNATVFPVDDVEWRKWANQHIYFRQGLSFQAMTPAQRDAALAMLGASLSAKGLELTRDIMRLNQTLGELNGNNFVEYGEWKFHMTVMGEPSASEPWGWQLDGHHLNVNYFVLGDQVVMTPAFWGSEPAVAKAGKYAGTAIMADEQNRGLALVRSLDAAQRRAAIVEVSKTGNNIMTQAFSDNVVLEYAGVRASTLTESQRKQLLDLIGLYVGNMREGHAKVRMAEVTAHLSDTYFAWIGGTEDDSVYYYRIQSPVILIEFDHQTPVGLRHLYPAGVPNQEHIHSVVRTPNGNDYGKDLLRQHYEQHAHPH
jgi:hypothetical protein